MTRGINKKKHKGISIQLFNEIVKTGDEVYYYDDCHSVKKDTVKHESTEMGGHTPVMWLKDAGSYLLSRFISKA